MFSNFLTELSKQRPVLIHREFVLSQFCNNSLQKSSYGHCNRDQANGWNGGEMRVGPVREAGALSLRCGAGLGRTLGVLRGARRTSRPATEVGATKGNGRGCLRLVILVPIREELVPGALDYCAWSVLRCHTRPHAHVWSAGETLGTRLRSRQIDGRSRS